MHASPTLSPEVITLQYSCVPRSTTEAQMASHVSGCPIAGRYCIMSLMSSRLCRSFTPSHPSSYPYLLLCTIASSRTHFIRYQGSTPPAPAPHLTTTHPRCRTCCLSLSARALVRIYLDLILRFGYPTNTYRISTSLTVYLIHTGVAIRTQPGPMSTDHPS